jgi:hypothetical protein
VHEIHEERPNGHEERRNRCSWSSMPYWSDRDSPVWEIEIKARPEPRTRHRDAGQG